MIMRIKQKLYRYAIIAYCLMSCVCASSQELNCSVEINSQQVQNANKSIFSTLQQAIADYMNTREWTDATFAPNERIECKMFLTVKSYDEPVMTCDLQVQSLRPVYNSSYTTTLINHKDTKVVFSYRENDPLVYSELSADDNLTSILNFYAYLIIGLDFDSFALEGGSPYYEKASNVVRMAQSTSEVGWKLFEDSKNRAAVLSAYSDKQTSAIRNIMYSYHRLGLDAMVVSAEKGRMEITKSLKSLKELYDKVPMSVCFSILKDTKLDELINVYSKASDVERKEIYELLYSIYPTENSKLERIKRDSKNR